MGQTTEGNDSNDKRTENNAQHKHNERYDVITRVIFCVPWGKWNKYLYFIIQIKSQYINNNSFQYSLLDLWSPIGNSNLSYQRQVAVQRDKLENTFRGLGWKNTIMLWAIWYQYDIRISMYCNRSLEIIFCDTLKCYKIYIRCNDIRILW